MEIKDYYSTLELPPTASPDDIKKAYRRLAQQYHPDKTGDDPHARAQFNAIKEAYETLTTPHRREAYLQERWLAQSQGLKDHWIPTTPEALLQKLLTLEKKLYHTDAHRAEYASWVQQVESWLSEETLLPLKEFRDLETEKASLDSCLRMAQLIPYPHVVPLLEYSRRLCQHPAQIQKIERLLQKSRRSARIEKLKPLIAAIIVLLICLLLFAWGRQH